MPPMPTGSGPGRILFILGEPPFPVDTGSRIRTHHFIEAAREHGLHLYLIHAGEATTEPATTVQGLFRQVWSVSSPDQQMRHRLAEPLRRLAQLLQGKPWEHLDPQGDALGIQIKGVLAQQSFDYIFCRYMSTARHLLVGDRLARTRLIVDLDDVEPLKAARHILLSTQPGTYRRWRLLLNNRLFEAFHHRLTRADAVLVCSEQDQRYVQAKGWSTRVEVIPNAVNAPAHLPPSSPATGWSTDRTLLFCGNLAYGPNIEGLLWFLDSVWPQVTARINDARLLIVGKNPAPELRRYIDDRSVVLHANVQSVSPFYQQATASVAARASRSWSHSPTFGPWYPPPWAPKGWRWSMAGTA